MSLQVTLENVKKAVTRDGNDRLRQELKTGQRGLNETEILALDRRSLISYVVALRMKANQLISVKKEIVDFDYKKVVLFTQTEVADADLTRDGATGGEEKLELGDQSVLIQLMMMMKSDKLDRETRDRE